METILIIIFILVLIGYLGNEFGKSKTKDKRKTVLKVSDNKAGFINGRHYTDYVEKVKELKRQKEYSKAIKLLLKLVDAVESESKIKSKELGVNWGLSPWYYNQLAIIYRKEKLYDEEVSILERYLRQEEIPENSENQMAQRLKKAKKLACSKEDSRTITVAFNYNPNIIKRQGAQLLESLYILSNTKNIDTLKERYEFIEKIYDDFIKASSYKRFVSDIQNSIDEYKTTYYDRIPNELEIVLLIKPDKEYLRKFYINCIFNYFKRFKEEQEKQIKSLKRQDAKDKRIKNILSVAKETKKEIIDKSINNEKIDTYLIEIDESVQAYNKTLES